MAAPQPSPDSPATWLYANDIRLVTGFLGAAMVVFGMGMLLLIALGPDGLEGADFFLGLGIFISLFAALLFIPRLRSRGPMSYSLVVPREMNLVEDAVRAALEASGLKAEVEVAKARFEVPPRTVRVDGVLWHFALRDAPYRRTRGDSSHWTELVQARLDDEKDEVARELRERVASRLAAPMTSGT